MEIHMRKRKALTKYSIRTVRRFLWFPMRWDGETLLWLETVEVVQQYDDDPNYKGWHDQEIHRLNFVEAAR